jgi:hypothetical protein
MKEEQLMKKLRRREEEQQKAVEIVMKNLLQVQSLAEESRLQSILAISVVSTKNASLQT